MLIHPAAHRRLLALFLGVFFTLVVAHHAAAAGRFEEFTEKFKSTPDQAKVVAAGCLGGSGTEWFAGGGFQPDGTIVAAGIALGPTLDLGVPVIVLGKDAPAPAAPAVEQRLGKNGQPELDKDGKPKRVPLSWKHASATAFVVRLGADLKPKSAARLPWQSAGLTACVVDAQGAIYLAGPAGDGVGGLSADTKELPPASADKGDCARVYLAKLTPDATKIAWVRHFKGPSPAPQLTLDAKGRVILQTTDVRIFDATGALVSTLPYPSGGGGSVAFNPATGGFARYGEHHWPTGREPYRDPILNIFGPDGRWLHQFYDWDGPLVGLDSLRLVSDSAIRNVIFAPDGTLVLYAWSDGGNSVMYREPFDVRTPAPGFKGTGMSAWGAGVLSCAYVIKLDPQSWHVRAGTLLASYMSNNKPNSIRLTAMAVAGDGSVCLGGGSSSGLIQTGNHIGGLASDGANPPSGNFAGVLSSDLTTFRFSSALPGTGDAEVTGGGGTWGIATGALGGKPHALFFGSALPETQVNVRGPQKQFGGGQYDGFLLLLDLSAK